MLLSNILEKYQPDISAERSSWNRHSLLFAYLNEYFYAFPHDEQKKFNFHLFYLSKYLFFFKFNFEFVLNIFQISSIYYLLETNYNFKEIVLAFIFNPSLSQNQNQRGSWNHGQVIHTNGTGIDRGPQPPFFLSSPF